MPSHVTLHRASHVTAFGRLSADVPTLASCENTLHNTLAPIYDWPRCEWVVIGPTAKFAHGTTFPNHIGVQYANVSAAVCFICAGLSAFRRFWRRDCGARLAH